MALTKISTAMWNSVPHHDTHDFNVDDVLYVDVSANRVGIGTLEPQVELEIASGAPQIRLTDTDGGYCEVVNVSGNLLLQADKGNTQSSSYMRFDVDAIERMRIEGTGDISFRDTSANEAFYWDASAIRLGIGAGSSPNGSLDVRTDGQSGVPSLGTAGNGINLTRRDGQTGGSIGYTTQGDIYIQSQRFDSANANDLFLQPVGGRVGINQTSPNSFFSNASQLVIGDGSTSRGMTIYGSSSGDSQIFFADGTTGDQAYRGIFRYEHSSDSMVIFTSATERMRINSSGSVIATVDMRAPIFYDSDNTSYYVDPASRSNLGTLVVNSAAANSSGYGVDFYGHLHMHNYEINYVSQLHFNDNVRFYDDGNDSYLNFKWGDSGPGGIKFIDGDGLTHGYVYGDGGGGFGLLDKDGQWALYTNGTSELQLRSNDNVEFVVYNSYTYSPGSSRAPIFYDSDNTNWYVNPASTSTTDPSGKFAQYVQIGDSATYNSNDGTWGARLNVTDNIHARIDVAQDANSMRSAWMAHTGQTGPIFGSMTAHPMRMMYNGSEVGLWDSARVQHTSSVRGPIFYDSDNTGYYVDPASTSVLNTVSHNGLSMTNGTAIDQLKTYVKSLQLATSWIDTGINGSDLSSGVYIFSLFASDSAVGGGHYSETYAGIISWYGDNTNSTVTDEIIISSRSGHAPNAGDIQLRIKRTSSADPDDLVLQIKANYTASGSSNYTFKFRRMI